MAYKDLHLELSVSTFTRTLGDELQQMDSRVPPGQQMSDKPLLGEWASGPVQTQQPTSYSSQQAAQSTQGMKVLKLLLVPYVS